jgi:hypothetical protein
MDESGGPNSNLSKAAHPVGHFRMPSKLRTGAAFALGAAVLMLIFCAVLSLLWALDVRNDRKHSVSVNMSTPVFDGSGGDNGCHGTAFTTVEPGAKLPVRRIRYLKDCAAIDVVLPDGRTGYLVLGVGDVSVNPPLPRI